MDYPNWDLLCEPVDEIVRWLNPVGVVCFGSRTHVVRRWSALEDSVDTFNEFDLLIITQPEAKYNDHALYDKVLGLTPMHIQIFSIAHRLPAVVHAVGQGHEFFSNVLRFGKVLYQIDTVIADIPVHAVHVDVRQKESVWSHYSNLALQFLEGAKYHKSKNHFAISLFELHQVVEHVSTAIIYCLLGYRATTHNLKQMLSLVKIISGNQVIAFLQNTEEDKRLFGILAKAYSDARYQTTYQVNPTDVEIIFNRVENFLDAILTLYKKRSNEPMFIANKSKVVL